MTVIPIEKKVLSENQRIAVSLRNRYRERGIVCLNLVSSPGSGKTTLLEHTLAALGPENQAAVLTGDLQTENDATRLARYGFPVQQITTGTICHLDGTMIERALEKWDLDQIGLLFIENVGNLVCPSSYDLGEEAKIVLLSVTEGEDKPLKYPSMFAKAELLVLTKIDLLPHLTFDMAEVRANAMRVHPGIEIIELSCKTGEGMDVWLAWLRGRTESMRARASESVPVGSLSV